MCCVTCLQLEMKQKENFATAKSLRERVVTLWDRLQVPESERSEFNIKCTGFKPKTLRNASKMFDFSF